MGKVKSAICLALMSLLIAVMCFFCTVSFRMNDIETFHSTVSLTGKDITLGSQLDEDNYLGGGYTATYYPEGVISEKEYEKNLFAYEAAEDTDKVNEYKEKYPEALKMGGLYLESEVVSEDGKTVSDEFKAKFEKTVCVMRERYEALHVDGMKMEVASDYSLRVTLPQAYGVRNSALQYMAYTGELTVAVGSDESSATTVLPENKRGAVIGDYLKGFSMRTAANGVSYVVVTFTSLGKEVMHDNTENTPTVFYKIGDKVVTSGRLEAQIDSSTMYFTSASSEGAKALKVLLNSALNDGAAEDLSVTCADMVQLPATYGDNALFLIYIAFAVCFVAMATFFFVRYGLLGFAHLFTYLMFLFAMLLCVWAIPFLNISVGTTLGLLLASVVLAACNALVYEYARKEYAQGRTMTASVKSAYKKTFWHVLDLHIVLAAIAFIIYGISLTGLSSFAFTFGLGIGFSVLCSLFVGRFVWACMMSFTTKKGNFCRFKREEVEDDD